MSLQDRFDSGLRFRATEGRPVKQGGIWKDDNGQDTFTDGQGNKFWFIDTTAGNVTVNLPDASEVTADTIFTVKRKTGGVNTLTVQSAVGNIDGAATHSINTQYAAYSYISDGANYWII